MHSKFRATELHHEAKNVKIVVGKVALTRAFAVVLIALISAVGVLVFRSHPFVALSPASTAVRPTTSEKQTAPPLTGAAAHKYLEETGDGQALMTALLAKRFGLKREQDSPFESHQGPGYLAMSHDQNLNAWFSADGIMIRPTLAEKDREKRWQLGFHLKAYGYGRQLNPAPIIVSQKVNGNRIEYDRQELVEWYENEPGGIEQGFTLSSRPQQTTEAKEPLRLVMAVTGDLRARVKDEGNSIELAKLSGERVLSYSKLTALDANGKECPARMEASANGRDISLIVDDKDAVYPLVIDPITASLAADLNASARQTDARFGFAVAISGNRAVIGAWRHDVAAKPDVGRIFIFERVSATWTEIKSISPVDESNAACGWSVSISSTFVAYGCPGANSQRGRAFLDNITAGTIPTELPGPNGLGDQFGYSISVKDVVIVVGAPFSDASGPDSGSVSFFFHINLDLLLPATFSFQANERLGTSLAAEDHYFLVGAPGFDSGRGRAVSIDSGGGNVNTLFAADGQAGDGFGDSVAVAGNTGVVGAFGDDDVATDAGSAYVFVRDNRAVWSQQQKLTASDGRANDHFSEHGVAIDGDTIVVGANSWDAAVSGDDAGAVYIFARSGTVWTRQGALFGDPAENFGIGVGISGDTLIVGARGATAFGTTRSGAARIYHLSCLPPGTVTVSGNSTVCARGSAAFTMSFAGSTPPQFTVQWRKNGVNIPGATSNNYTINSAATSDAGSYDVLVSTDCGTSISAPVSLTVFTYSLSPTSQNLSASGSSGIFNVTSTGSCGWTAVPSASWINITSGATGTAPGQVGFTVAANTGASRTGTITVADKTFTINQDGTAPPANVVQFSSSNYNVVEDCTTLTITVNRIGDTSSAASVNYSTSDVTASERRDYITALGKLDFAPGQTSKTFGVLINEDSYVEGNETFNVNLTNPVGVGLGGPSISTVQITDDATEPATNVIDDPQSFVCQHYHDFLNRAPDQGGLTFWTNEITSCGSNQACIELKRINVSAAYFLSIEFQQTGYLVERLYKSAYGSASGTSTFGGSHQLSVPVVRFSEFLSDTQRIGQGVIVGQSGWEQVLENNKQAFVLEFTQRARFTTAFPNSITVAQFVDSLNVNAGNPLSVTERNQLVNSGMTRAQILRAVAEDPDLVSGESNRAFVLMQFFGYLRRNPNDPQDVDYTGYDFWLSKLNQFNGNYQSAEMVKAFITASEYRNRFGP